MAENRNMAIDMAKGIGILLVIIGHTAGMKHIGQELIYSFHMPLFFIIAGYFYKPSETWILMKHSFRRLIVPWAITLSILILLCLLMGNFDEALGFAQGLIFPDGSRDDILLLSGMHSSGAIWFLPALFWCRVVYNWVYQVSDRNVFIICFLITVVAILIGRFVLNAPLAFGIGCSATIFYAAGHIIFKKQLLNVDFSLWIVIPVSIMWLLYERYVDFEMFAYNYGITYLQDAMIAVAISYIILVVCNRLANCYLQTMGGVFVMFRWLGINSLMILCTHTIGLLWIRSVLSVWNVSEWMITCVNLVNSIGLVIIYNYLKKWICQH